MKTSAPAMAIGTTITLMPNAHRHDATVVRVPPTTGPNAEATPAVDPHAANAAARSGPSNDVDRIASAAGSRSAAPRPSITASPMTNTATFRDRPRRWSRQRAKSR